MKTETEPLQTTLARIRKECERELTAERDEAINHALDRDALSVSKRSLEAIRKNLHACINELVAKRDALREVVKVKDEALREAAETFERYAEMHDAKYTVEAANKACANRSHANRCRAALSQPQTGKEGQ